MSSADTRDALAAGAIFREAIEYAEDERPGLLDMRCAGDQRLRRQVEAMLASDANGAETPLLNPGGSATLRDAAAEAVDRWANSDEAQPVRLEPGVMVGRYRIVRRIAEGGSSVVFEAVQESTGLGVALKVHRFGFGSGSTRRRFLDESKILARLHHRAIARVHDAGIGRRGGHDDFDDGDLPWIAVELVPGAAPILAACDARRLDRDARLRLFETVCDAVQHAHRRGVIHRDLKPANVLVGEDGQPKVIDFGIGRLTEETMLRTITTDLGALRGTVGYMSPEQCAGAAEITDVRSDVYSLGVVLFELLCAAPPRDLAELTPLEVMRLVATSPVRHPSSIDPMVNGDLEAILLHALEREPDDRYQSAEALGQDIGRFLRSEPIEARPPGWVRRVALFARRNRAVAALLAVVAVLLTTLLVTVPTLYVTTARMQREIDDAFRSLTGFRPPGREERREGMLVAPIFGDNRRFSRGTMLLSLPSIERRLGLLLLDAGSDIVASASFELDIPPQFNGAPKRSLSLIMARVDDFVRGHPGDEVLAVLASDDDVDSQIGLVRIYDLNLVLLREAWTVGAPTSATWTSQTRQLVMTIDVGGMRGLRRLSTELSPYDARFCAGAGGGPSERLIVGCSIDAVQGMVFPPLPECMDRAMPLQFVLARAPDELKDGSWRSVFGSAAVADPGSDSPAAVASIGIDCFDAIAPIEARKSAIVWTDINREGGLLDQFSAAPTEANLPAPRLIRIDPHRAAFALAHPMQPLRRIVAELDDLDDQPELARRVRVDPDAAAGRADFAVGMAMAMVTNWRELHRVAEAIIDDPALAVRADRLAHAMRLAERAVEIHDSRCPAADACDAGWYCHAALTRALIAAERFADALASAERAQRLAANQRTAGTRPISIDLAWQSLCWCGLGRLDEAEQRLAEAVDERASERAPRDGADLAIERARECLAEARSRPTR